MGRHTKKATLTPVRERRRRAIPVAVGLIACAAVVWQSSHATFSDTTDSSGNRIGAGSVDIEVNNSGSPLFSVALGDTTLAPGASDSACIGVEYRGTLPSAGGVALYFPQSAAQESDNGAAYGAWADSTASMMDDTVTIQVEVNDADLAADPGGACTGNFTDVIPAGTTLRSLISGNSTFASGYTVPTMATGTFRSYRFTYTFPGGAPNTVQGDGIEFAARWEARQ
jgi:hypothetical protein